VLLNHYPDGKAQMGWHSDAEPELGRNPVIASLSFGAARSFQLRHNQTKELREFVLEHGSLLLMGGTVQHFWKHCLPATSRSVKERFNLTFRYTKPASA
jgi:alkylated DNA repair dioxygenase AlkB